jgi:hypothetical protein
MRRKSEPDIFVVKQNEIRIVTQIRRLPLLSDNAESYCRGKSDFILALFLSFSAFGVSQSFS